MERDYFLTTDRTLFSKWEQDDLPLARELWGDPEVTRFICVSGCFTAEEIVDRLSREIVNDAECHVQYWPVFQRETKELVGCCGLRPHGAGEYEMGIHLRPKFWGQGYGIETSGAVIRYAFTVLCVETLFAGHNPNNVASRKLLGKLGFSYIGDEFYEPTGLYHPSYELQREKSKISACIFK